VNSILVGGGQGNAWTFLSPRREQIVEPVILDLQTFPVPAIGAREDAESSGNQYCASGMRLTWVMVCLAE
jgi:hypothetical protein